MAGARKSVRVRGVTYTGPDDAYVGAETIEHHADELAADLRRSGKDGEADQIQDRGHADAERLREFAREREQAEAEAVEQPADRPTEPARKAGGARRRASRRSGSSARRRSARRSSGGAFTPRTRQAVAATAGTLGEIPGASSVSTLLLQAAGMTLGIAFLTLLLTGRGVSAFASLAGGAASGLSWLIDPVDPLAPRPKVAPAAASRQAAAYAAAAASTRRRSSTVTHPTATVAGALH